MSRGSHTFKQADVTRAIKAVVAAGVPVVRVRINTRTGEIEILTVILPEAEPLEPKREIVL
jgi:hypothetical protein